MHPFLSRVGEIHKLLVEIIYKKLKLEWSKCDGRFKTARCEDLGSCNDFLILAVNSSTPCQLAMQPCRPQQSTRHFNLTQNYTKGNQKRVVADDVGS
jgi:hypothetical protein